MDSEEFRKRGKELIDFIIDYKDGIEKRRVTADVKPGFIREKMPSCAPEVGEDWAVIMREVNDVIMPGVTHWQHPNFHSYVPMGSSYSAILGAILTDGLGIPVFSWISNPIGTELEMIMMDWMGKMIGLPNDFLHEGGVGGGVIQGGASENILVTLLAARHTAITSLKNEFPLVDKVTLLSKLVAYTSKLGNCCVEKNATIAFVKLRQLEVDAEFSLRGSTLQRAIRVCGTLGTTACCSFDNIEELGEVCKQENIWLHIDAAYAGNALVCPEYRHLLHGIQNWGISLSRRFRALKLWLVIRSHGIHGIQKQLREKFHLAKEMEKLLQADEKFEMIGRVTLGFVCFRLKRENWMTQKLMGMIDESGQLAMTLASVDDRYFIKFVVCSQYTRTEHIKRAWNIISDLGNQVLSMRGGGIVTEITDTASVCNGGIE